MRLGLSLLLLVVFIVGLLSGWVLQASARPASSAASAGLDGDPAPAPASEQPAGVASRAASTAADSIPEGLTQEEGRNIAIFRTAAASVVNITSIALRRDFWSANVFEIPQGSGSGFVWDRDGHIVTNFHVIENGSSFEVNLSDGTTAEAEPVGAAPDKDLAVLRIRSKGGRLVPLQLGRSRDLAVGQTVLALGNPFGLDHSLTVGVVSALGRELQSPGGRTIRDVIQTDAAINPGNSGGPLLDSHGRLVGVNSAIYSPSGAYAGIGFAIPVDTVKRLVPQLIEHGKPIQAGIGVSLLSDSWAQRMRVEGAVIYDVKRGGPAERAGLEGLRSTRSGRMVLGDVIVAVDGKPIRSGDDLYHAFEAAGVGATVSLSVQRDGRKRDVPLRLIELE